MTMHNCLTTIFTDVVTNIESGNGGVAVELMTPSRWSVGGRVQMPPGFYVQEVKVRQDEASYPVGVVCTYYPFK